MRSAYFRPLFSVLLFASAAAHAQINPQTQINWPNACVSNSGTVYNAHDNVCFTPSGGPGGGLPVNNPAFTGVLTGPVANFADKAGSRTNLNMRQATPLDYGAVGDAKKTADGSMTSGSTTLTSGSSLFSATDVGKTISIQGAGGTGGSIQPLVTTIVSVISPTQVRTNAAATQTVGPAGVLWGTDNYNAFDQWRQHLNGNLGVIPSGNFLVNTQGTKSLDLGSNQTILMDQGGSIYYVGANISSSWALFNIPCSTTQLMIDGMNITGEFQVTSSLVGISNGYPYGSAIAWNYCPDSAGSGVIVQNSTFKNLLGIALFEFNSTDAGNFVTQNKFIDIANTAVNVNSPTTFIDHNYFSTESGAIEASGCGSHIDNNMIPMSGGQYVIAAGGNTAGAPCSGGTVDHNTLLDIGTAPYSITLDDKEPYLRKRDVQETLLHHPVAKRAVAKAAMPRAYATSGCISLGDAFDSGSASNNYCHSSHGALGIVNTYNGYVNDFNNRIQGNTISGVVSANMNAAIYLQGVQNTTVSANKAFYTVNGLSTSGATNTQSSNNFYNGALKDISINGSSTAYSNDFLANGTYEAISGSSFSNNSIFNTPSQTVFNGAPLFLKGPVLGPQFASQIASSGAATTVPGWIYTGDAYAVTYEQGFTGPGGVNQPAPNCHTWRGVGSGTNNHALPAICAEYNLNYSSNVAFWVPKYGDTAYAENADMKAMIMGDTFSFTHAEYPTVVINSLLIGPPPSGLLNPNGYPDPGNMEVTGNLKVDGTCTGCSTGVTDVNGNQGSLVMSFGTGAGSCTYTAPTTTCTFTGSGTGTPGVTNFLAPPANWPSWLVPSVLNSTTVPELHVTASAIPFSALATINADTWLGNPTAASATPTSSPFPSSGTNGCSGPTNALNYSNSIHQIGCNTAVGTVNLLQVNGTNMLSQAALNFLNSTTNATGLAVVRSNPSGGGQKDEITGTLNIANLGGFASPHQGDIAIYSGSAWVKFAGNTNAATPYLSENASGVAAWIAGGSQSWPAAAGIANYAGASAWGTSYNNSNLVPANFLGINQTIIYTVTTTASAADNGKLVVLNCASCSYNLPAAPPATPWKVSVINAPTSAGFIALSGAATWYGGTTAPQVSNSAAIQIYANSATSGDYQGDSQIGVSNTVTFTTGTTAVAANSCTSETTLAIPGVTTGSAFYYATSQDVRGVTGWGSTGGLKIVGRASTGAINWSVCNETASSITPSASVTWNVGH